MSKQIWKFSLHNVCDTIIEIPKGGEILTCQLQGNTPTIWAMVDTEKEKGERTFGLVGTGHEISESWKSFSYINTIQLPNGIVIHVFEIYK